MSPATATAAADAGYKVLQAGLSFTRPLSLSEWVDVGVRLVHVETRMNFAIGDWLVHADQHGLLRNADGEYGDLYGQASLITGRPFAWLQLAMRVSVAFPLEARAFGVSWSFYRAVLPLQAEERARTLQIAVSNRWRIGALTDYVSGRGTGDESQRARVLAPATGGSWPRSRKKQTLRCPSCGFRWHPTAKAGRAADRLRDFTVGQPVRYKPGVGTYGYEDALEPDGRLPGVVVGHTPTRVRVELTLTKRRGITVRRCVDAASLVAGDLKRSTA